MITIINCNSIGYIKWHRFNDYIVNNQFGGGTTNDKKEKNDIIDYADSITKFFTFNDNQCLC